MTGPEDYRGKDVGIHHREAWVHIPAMMLTSYMHWSMELCICPQRTSLRIKQDHEFKVLGTYPVLTGVIVNVCAFLSLPS